MPTLTLKTTVADDRHLAINLTLPPDFPTGIIEIVVRTEEPRVAAHEFAAIRRAALDQARARLRGLLPSSAEFAARKQEEIELEERKFAR